MFLLERRDLFNFFLSFALFLMVLSSAFSLSSSFGLASIFELFIETFSLFLSKDFLFFFFAGASTLLSFSLSVSSSLVFSSFFWTCLFFLFVFFLRPFDRCFYSHFGHFACLLSFYVHLIAAFTLILDILLVCLYLHPYENCFDNYFGCFSHFPLFTARK